MDTDPLDFLRMEGAWNVKMKRTTRGPVAQGLPGCGGTRIFAAAVQVRRIGTDERPRTEHALARGLLDPLVCVTHVQMRHTCRMSLRRERNQSG